MSNMSTGSVEVLRERERQARMRHQLLVRESSPQPIFSEPIKVNYSPQDETSRRIRDTLGDFNQIQPFLASDSKYLIGIARTATGAPVPSRSNPGSGEPGRNSSNVRMAVVSSNRPLSTSDSHKKPLSNGQYNRSSNSDKSHSSILSSKNSDKKSVPRQRIENHIKSSSHHNPPQDVVQQDKPRSVSSQQSCTSTPAVSSVVNRGSPANLLNVNLSNGSLHSSYSKRTSAKQNLTILKIPEPADPNTDSHIELENILKEMKQAVPPPLTAIETPRTEETRFHFSPQDHSVLPDAPSTIKTFSTPIIDPSVKEATPSINLDKDLEMSDSDDDDDDLAELSPTKKVPHILPSPQSPSLRILKPPPLLQAMSSSSATSSGSDSEEGTTESNESDSSVSTEHSVAETVVKPKTRSWKLSDFMDKKNSPPFIPLDTGGSNSASKDDHFTQGHLSAMTEKDTLVDEDSVNCILGKCCSQDIKDYFKESPIPELELEPSSPADLRTVPEFPASPPNSHLTPLRGPRTPPLPAQDAEREEEENEEEEVNNNNHHSKRTGPSGESKDKSHEVKNVKIKIRLGKVSSSANKCKGFSELEKSSVSVTKDNSACKESRKTNVEVSSSVTKAPATTTTNTSVPSAASCGASTKSHKHTSSSVSKKEKFRVNNSSSKELKMSESVSKSNNLPKENSPEIAGKGSDFNIIKDHSVNKDGSKDQRTSRENSASKENVCKDHTTSNSNSIPKCTSKENKNSVNRKIPKKKTKTEKPSILHERKSDYSLKKIPKSKEFLTSSDSDSDGCTNIEEPPSRTPSDLKREMSIKNGQDVKKENAKKDIDVNNECDVKKINAKKELDITKEPDARKEIVKKDVFKRKSLKSSLSISKLNRPNFKPKEHLPSSCSSSVTEVINSVARGDIFLHRQSSPLHFPSNRTSFSEIANLSSTKVCERLETTNKDSPVNIVPPQLLSPIPQDSLNAYEFKENAIPSVVVSIDLTFLQRVPPYPPVYKSHTLEKCETRERTDCSDSWTRKDTSHRKHLKEKNSSVLNDKTSNKNNKISNDTFPKVCSESIVTSPSRKRKNEDDRSSCVKKKLKISSKIVREKERKEKPSGKESGEPPSEPKATPKSLERCDSASSLSSFTSQQSQKSLKLSKKNVRKVQAKECQESKRFKSTSQSSLKETKDLKKEEKQKTREKKFNNSGSCKEKERNKAKEKSNEKECKKSSDSGWEDGTIPSSQGSNWEDSGKFDTFKLSSSQQAELIGTSSGCRDWEPTAPDQHQVTKPSNKQHSTDYYFAEGKKLKHQANKEKDKVIQATKYLEAVLFFILTGNAMEHNNMDTEKIYKMFKDTLDISDRIIAHIHQEPNSSSSNVENKLAILSLMCRSLLFQKLYNMRKNEVRDSQIGISEFFKTLHINNRIPPTHSSPLPTSHLPYSSRIPQPSPCQPRLGGAGGSAPPPSPHSPTPSPAGSVASVGSQSSGYSSGELSGTHARSLGGGNHSTQFQSAVSQLQVPNIPQQQQGMVSVPQNIMDLIQSQNTHLNNLHMCHELWEKADNLIRHNSKDFFNKLNEQCGQLSLHSSFTELVDFIRRGLSYLKDYH